MTEAVTEMPRSRSIAIQSERARRCSPRARTAPAIWMAPPNSNSFSVSVVLPASGCEMMAKVRRSSIAEAMSLILISGRTGSEDPVEPAIALALDDHRLAFGRRLAGGGIVLQALGLGVGIDDVAGHGLVLPEHQLVDEAVIGLDLLRRLFIDDAADVGRGLVGAGLGQHDLLALRDAGHG